MARGMEGARASLRVQQRGGSGGGGRTDGKGEERRRRRRWMQRGRCGGAPSGEGMGWMAWVRCLLRATRRMRLVNRSLGPTHLASPDWWRNTLSEHRVPHFLPPRSAGVRAPLGHLRSTPPLPCRIAE